MSGPREVVASAPSRIDLAGGTLDIWPLSMLVPGAVTVNLAIDLRAEARLREIPGTRARFRSVDRRRSAVRRLPLAERPDAGPLALLETIAASFASRRAFELRTRAMAPAGAGLGGSSTLAVAVGAAFARWSGVRLDRVRLLRRVMNLEARSIGVPTGNQDYLAALHGGLAAYHHEPDGTRREGLEIPPGLEGRLVVAYTGEPRESGFSNWEMFRRFVDGERVTVRRLHEIARIAGELREAIAAGDLDLCGRLVGEEGRLRYRLAPSVGTPLLRACDRAARRAGALGFKVCGAGGGGCCVAVCRAGRAGAVVEAMRREGAEPLEVKIARRGLRVDEERAVTGAGRRDERRR